MSTHTSGTGLALRIIPTQPHYICRWELQLWVVLQIQPGQLLQLRGMLKYRNLEVQHKSKLEFIPSHVGTVRG